MIVGGDLEEDSRYTGVEEGDPAAGDHGSQHDLFDFKKTSIPKFISFRCEVAKWLRRQPAAMAVLV